MSHGDAMNLLEWVKKEWHVVEGNAKWDFYKYGFAIAGTSVVAVGAYLVHRLQYGPDWLPYAVVFVLALIVFIWMGSRPVEQKGVGSPSVKSVLLETTTKSHSQVIDGELYRITVTPRSVAWPLLKDVYRIQGHPEDARTDTDILVEMYLVNTTKEIKHIRDIKLSVEIAGKRMPLERQPDLDAEAFSGMQFEYGLKPQAGDEAQQIKLLCSSMPVALAPEQPIEGWMRFLAKEVNPDAFDDKTWQFLIVDSVGNEYPLVKISSRERKGEIGLRRVRS
jgi:hypothetical protein